MVIQLQPAAMIRPESDGQPMAEQERQRAEQAEARAALIAEQLRASGIAPKTLEGFQ